MLSLGVNLTGIDISSEAINKAKKLISNSGYKANHYIMNAEKSDFSNSDFDLIVGSGILHHLDINNAYKELSRIYNLMVMLY